MKRRPKVEQGRQGDRRDTESSRVEPRPRFRLRDGLSEPDGASEVTPNGNTSAKCGPPTHNPHDRLDPSRVGGPSGHCVLGGNLSSAAIDWAGSDYAHPTRSGPGPECERKSAEGWEEGRDPAPTWASWHHTMTSAAKGLHSTPFLGREAVRPAADVADGATQGDGKRQGKQASEASQHLPGLSRVSRGAAGPAWA